MIKVISFNKEACNFTHARLHDDLSISVKETEGESLNNLKKLTTDEFNKKMNDFFEPYLKNYEDDVLWTLSHPDADEKRKLL